jgi:transcription-repair coupling factor (superfamily II helicase)
MDVYRRIALTKETHDLELMREELTDLFGPVPEQVTMFLDLTEIRVRASKHNIKSIIVQDSDLIFSFETPDQVADLFARAPGRVRIPDKTTVHFNLEKNYFQPRTLMAILRKLL